MRRGRGGIQRAEAMGAGGRESEKEEHSKWSIARARNISDLKVTTGRVTPRAVAAAAWHHDIASVNARARASGEQEKEKVGRPERGKGGKELETISIRINVSP